MCTLCGLGDAAQVIQSANGTSQAHIWPDNAAEILAEKGLNVANADALFSGAEVMAETEATLPGVAALDDTVSFNAFFDVPSGVTTPFSLGVGQRLNAEISAPGDTDWFGMFLTAGETYQISLKSLPFFGLGDAKVFLFDQFGNYLLDDDNGGDGTDALMTFTATRSGVYFTGATGFGGDAQTTGAYEISLGIADFDADTVGDIPALAAPIAEGSSAGGRIDFSFDEDWYEITVEKGKTYAAFLESDLTSFTPLADPFLEVADRRLAVVASNNDNGITRDAALTFTADYNGVYYIKAKGGPGNTGDFRLTVADFTPETPPSPVDGIDWGVKMADPDISYYFAKAGESFGNEFTEDDWNAYEKQQASAALNEFTKIANLSFTEVTNAQNADFILTKSFNEGSTTGRMIPPDDAFGDLQGIGWFNTNPSVWSREAGGFLEPGAFGYSNFIHEFGHGLGLSHPHDNGGTSFVFSGVSGSGDIGDNGLNQEVFTVMSYNKGWRAGPNGSSESNALGIARTPMAFDIAKIQEKYGAKADHNEGKNIYRLFTENKTGTGYDAIWDTGGKDTIVNDGNAGATIDLREATLGSDAAGGGFVSFVSGIFGGFTIASGVVIENAKGGSAADSLIGNDVANLLDGRGGKDFMMGRLGNDRFVIDDKGDVVVENKDEGNDWVLSSVLDLDLGDYDHVENANLTGKSALDATGVNGANTLQGNKGDNALKGKGGTDTLKGGDGKDKLVGGGGGDDLKGNNGNDVLKGGGGTDRLEGGKGRDQIAGGKGADIFVFKGDIGNDVIRDFKKGADTLLLSEKLWAGTLTKQQVLDSFAAVQSGAVVLDFDTGSITLKGMATLTSLNEDIAFL